MQKPGASIKTALLWTLTVLFLIMALAYLPSVASFIALIAATLLLPIQKWQDMLQQLPKEIIKVLAVVTLAILFLATIPTAEPADNAVPQKSAPIATIETTTPTQSTTAPSTQPTTAPTTEPATQPTTVPASEPTTTPTTEPPTGRSTAPSVEPTAEPATTPGREPTAPPTEDEGGDYVLNTNTKKFHYPSCGSADQIKDKNKDYFHGTREELIEMGYDPCGRCDP